MGASPALGMRGPIGVRVGGSAGTLLSLRVWLPVPGVVGLSAQWSPDGGEPLSSWSLSHLVSQHIPTIHPAKCQLPFRTRPELSLCLFLGPNQQMSQCCCHGPKRLLSLLLVHPTAVPSSPCLLPVAVLPIPQRGSLCPEKPVSPPYIPHNTTVHLHCPRLGCHIQRIITQFACASSFTFPARLCARTHTLQ